MVTTEQKSKLPMLIMAAIIKNALELVEQQDAQIIKQAEQYAEEHGYTLWQGQGW